MGLPGNCLRNSVQFRTKIPGRRWEAKVLDGNVSARVYIDGLEDVTRRSCADQSSSQDPHCLGSADCMERRRPSTVCGKLPDGSRQHAMWATGAVDERKGRTFCPRDCPLESAIMSSRKSELEVDLVVDNDTARKPPEGRGCVSQEHSRGVRRMIVQQYLASQSVYLKGTLDVRNLLVFDLPTTPTAEGDKRQVGIRARKLYRD